VFWVRSVAGQWAIRGRSGEAKTSERWGRGRRDLFVPAAYRGCLRRARADWLVAMVHGAEFSPH
jgi:hypothetical protein